MTTHDNRRFSEEHEWVERIDASTVRIGITPFAQSQLGDIVFVELPQVGEVMEVGQSMGSIESVKTVSDLFCPVPGKVTAVNEKLIDAPELVNEAPFGDGWMVEIAYEGSLDEHGLMTWEKYDEMTRD